MPAYRSRAEVITNAIQRTLFSASAAFSMLAGIGTANAVIERSDGDVTPGDPLVVRLGLDGTILTQFTGEADQDGVEYYPEQIEVAGVGPLSRARRRVNTVDLTWPGAEPDPDLPTPEKLAYWAVGKTDIEHITALLELAGITEYDLEGTGEIVGDINPVTLPTGGNPWSLIQEIDRLTWYRTFDSPDGVVVRRPFSILPSAGAAMTLTQGVDLLSGQRTRTRQGMITNVHIVGTSYIGADDWPIVIEFATDNPETNEYGINDVLEYQSELFETEAQAEAWAATAMGEYGILQEKYSFTLIKGIPGLRAGMTVNIVSDVFGLGAASRFLVESVRHYSDGKEYLTAIEVRGSADPSATSSNRKPVPVVVVTTIHREWIDGQWVDTVGLDARGSYDPDGPAIGAYTWSGDPVDPVPIGDGMTAVVTYVGGIDVQTPNPPTVTLTVEDLMGAFATRTFPIVANVTAPIETRDLWVAVSSELLYSRDGNKTFETFAVAAVGCVREVSGYQLAWDAGGDLYKVTPDGTPLLVLAGAGVACAWESYTADGNRFTGVCYAGANDGTVYRSIDDAVSWVAMNITPLPGAITTISESPYAEGQVQVTAADGLYESFDAGASFVLRKAYGNPAMLATEFTAGFEKGLVGFTGTDTAHSHILERADAITVTFPTGHAQSAVRAMTVAASEQVFWVLATFEPGSGRSYQGDLLAGGELVEKAYDGALGEPRDMIRDPLIDGLVYFVQDASVQKTLDGFATTTEVLALTGGQVGRRLGIGPLRAALQSLSFFSTVGVEKVLNLWNGASNDAPPAGWQTIAFDDSAWNGSLSPSITSLPLPPAGAARVATRLAGVGFTRTKGLFRRHFSIPTGSIAFASLTFNLDDEVQEIYINEIPITGDVGYTTTQYVYDITAAIVPGTDNIMAVYHNSDDTGVGGGGAASWFAYALEVIIA